MTTLKDMIKKVNWELTPELHLDDGKQHGGAVWLLKYGEVRLEAIEWIKEDIKLDSCITPRTKTWMRRFDITEEEVLETDDLGTSEGKR